MFRALGRRLGFKSFLDHLDPGRHLLEAARAAGAALLSADCPCCRQPMGWGRYGVCEACWEEVEPVRAAGCAICGAAGSRFAPEAGSRCRDCRIESAPFAAVTSYGNYGEKLRELVHALKYEGRARLGRPLGSLAAAGLIVSGVTAESTGAIIVPVPLSRDRLARRGYNQSELIARSLRASLREETGRRLLLVPALRKIVETPPQAGRSRGERLRAPVGAYEVAPRSLGRVEGRSVILVDDVFTTGATAAECSRVLMNAGAGEIVVAVVARTKAGGDASNEGHDRGRTRR